VPEIRAGSFAFGWAAGGGWAG
jgi:hypothetical protein